MPPKIRSNVELATLTPAERRVGALLVTGLSNPQIAARLGLSPGSVNGHMAHISRKLPMATTREAKAHAILRTRQVSPPTASGRAPNLTETELRLLRAVAEQPSTHDIARAVGIAVADTRPAIRELVRRTHAVNSVHLIGLAHAWDLLAHDMGEVGIPSR